MSRRLLLVGDASWDLTLRSACIPEPDEKVIADELEEHAGGVIANTAVAASRAGVDTAVLLQLGDDWRGSSIRRSLEHFGVAVLVSDHAGSTALAVIVVDRLGEKRLWLHRGASMYPGITAIDPSLLQGIGWVHTAIYNRESAERLVELCRLQCVPWSIDLEPATFDEQVSELEGHINGAAVVFCNNAAAKKIGIDPVRTLFELGAQKVIRTLGDRGAELHSQEGSEPLRFATPTVQALDTTGAGDCLAGWYLAGIVQGLAEDVALQRAVMAASISCTRMGAQRSFPTKTELETAMTDSASASKAASPSSVS